MSDAYVFISYSRQDRSFVDRLTSELRQAGIQTWTDVYNIPAGHDWAQAIDRGLSEATAMIYVASTHSAKSKWMDAESRAFLERGGKIIPVVVDDDGPENLPPPLRRLQWVDFRGAFQPALGRVVDGIRELRGARSLPASKPKSKGYVFLSYADEDAEFVADLKVFLKKQGYGYWDYRESNRDYQADYTLELENVIKDAAATLSIVTPDWKRSPTALQELHFSREVQTPVFLLKATDPGPTLAISGMTYIDFTNKKNGFTQLDGEMRRKGL